MRYNDQNKDFHLDELLKMTKLLSSSSHHSIPNIWDKIRNERVWMMKRRMRRRRIV